MIETVEVSGKQKKKNVCSAAVRRTRAFANASPAREVVTSLGAGGLQPMIALIFVEKVHPTPIPYFFCSLPCLYVNKQMFVQAMGKYEGTTTLSKQT